MKVIKKILLIIMALLLMLSIFTGCDKTKVNNEDETNVLEETSEAETSTSSEMTTFNFSIPLDSISSEEANEIIEDFSLYAGEYLYETMNDEQNKSIVYSIYTGKGYDIEGKEYNANMQPAGKCSDCNRIKGIGENMCQGYCTLS